MSDALEHFALGRAAEETRPATPVDPARRYIRPSYHADRDAAMLCLTFAAAPFILLGVLLFFYFARAAADAHGHAAQNGPAIEGPLSH